MLSRRLETRGSKVRTPFRSYPLRIFETQCNQRESELDLLAGRVVMETRRFAFIVTLQLMVRLQCQVMVKTSQISRANGALYAETLHAGNLPSYEAR